MCGILGVISSRVDMSLFKKSLDRLSHRGPDGFGIWESEERDIVFGHRRLAIIDLTENGKQPMVWAERYVITFNGEIYNYQELRKQLENKGIHFRTNSDTEVLLALYAEEGPACLQKLNGMWAFAIHDRVENIIFLSRDRMGKKPLFYLQDKERFVFASEMKSLYPFMGEVSPNYSLIAEASQNCFSYESTEGCLVNNIRRFPAASYAILSNNNLIINKYWDVLDTLIEIPKRYTDQVEMFQDLFIDACKIRMRSDVTIGTALSGGIDSSATISTMAYVAKNQKVEYCKDWQHAFVASFPGSAIDESKEAQKVVDHIGINATFLNIDPLKDIDKLFYYTYLFEELYLTSPIPFIQLYGEVKQNGVTVTLDGHGSDELFGGYSFEMYPKFLDDFPNPWKMRKTMETINNLSSEPFASHREISWEQVLPVYKNSAKKILFKSESKIDGLDYYNSKLLRTTFQGILPTLLRNYDRYSMINGVEIRMPFLDHRIVSFAFSIPSTAKVRSGYSKSIVRDAMKGFIPDDIRLLKRKIGFNTPFSEWLKGPLKSWIMDEIASSDFRNSNLINHVQVEKYLTHLITKPDATFAEGERAWSLFMPYVWEKSLKFSKL